MESNLIELEAQMNALQAEKEAFYAKLDQVSRRVNRTKSVPCNRTESVPCASCVLERIG